jgi:hypothetical protein
MDRQRYRLKRQTLAVTEDRNILEIPAGAEIVLLEPMEPSEEKNRLLTIEWRGEKLKMFAVDLLARGERTRAVE